MPTEKFSALRGKNIITPAVDSEWFYLQQSLTI